MSSNKKTQLHNSKNPNFISQSNQQQQQQQEEEKKMDVSFVMINNCEVAVSNSKGFVNLTQVGAALHEPVINIFGMHLPTNICMAETLLVHDPSGNTKADGVYVSPFLIINYILPFLSVSPTANSYGHPVTVVWLKVHLSSMMMNVRHPDRCVVQEQLVKWRILDELESTSGLMLSAQQCLDLKIGLVTMIERKRLFYGTESEDDLPPVASMQDLQCRFMNACGDGGVGGASTKEPRMPDMLPALSIHKIMCDYFDVPTVNELHVSTVLVLAAYVKDTIVAMVTGEAGTSLDTNLIEIGLPHCHELFASCLYGIDSNELVYM
jgi:hypothetical protein